LIISVVGLGKIGLPLAVQAASKGHTVLGCDINESVVKLVNSGIPPFPGEKDLETRLRQVVKNGLFSASTDSEASVAKSQVVIIVVPVIVDSAGNPDFSWIDSATEDVGRGLQRGTLISYETTLPVGTTRGRFSPMLQSKSSLKPGQDFHLAYSPERISSGTAFLDFARYPKLVGGINEESESKAAAFYSSIFDFENRTDLRTENGVWSLGSLESAEFAKLAETTYRDVNIALANQFALHAEKVGVDIYKVIEACNSQPFSHLHQPGISVGGHCIPVYPYFYTSGDSDATVVFAARRINEDMPRHFIQKLHSELGNLEGKRIAVLGLAYRGGVKEHAFSGALQLSNLLREINAIPLVHDPLYSEDEIIEFGLDPFRFGDLCDAAILHTNHIEYQSLTEADIPGAKIVLDGRNVAPKAIRNSIRTYVLGLPDPQLAANRTQPS
jgi:nucleotide sugar dehydrogenase